MARDVTDTTPIESRDQLVAWIEKGCKPRSAYRIGTEHEKFPFYRANHAPVPYQGERGIRALLAGMQQSLGWEPIIDGRNLIGLADGTGLGAISLEPGGQFELSGAPLETVHDTELELKDHLERLHAVARPRRRLPRPWAFADLDARRDADHAQAPLRHHAGLYAEGRHARARHDAAHLAPCRSISTSPRKPTW